MPTNSVFIVWDLWVAAFCGAASKTYLDWKTDSQRLVVVFWALIANTSFALIVGPQVAELFITSLPEWSNFGKAVAYVSGSIAINVMSGFVAISWKDIILAKIKGKK